MANMFEMVKQAASMKKQMKKIQKELEKKTVEETSGGVTVVARGDMSVKSIKIALEDIDAAHADRLEKMIVAAVNKAMESAKKKAASEMSALTGGLGGLGDMFK